MRLRRLIAKAKSILRGRPETYSHHYDRIFWSLRNSDIAIDCGANIGHYTAIMARSGATVFAFEPNPHAFKVLQHKFQSARNVHCLQQAVHTENTKLSLYFHVNAVKDPIHWSTGSSLFSSKSNIDATAFTEVAAIDFAAFVEGLGRPVALVKMDIEGAEASVLSRLIERGTFRKIQHLLVETHDQRLPETAEQMKHVRKQIREMGLSNIDLGWT